MDLHDRIEFAKNELRIKYKVSAKEFYDKTGFTSANYSKFIKQKGSTGIEKIMNICLHFDVNPSYLLLGESPIILNTKNNFVKKEKVDKMENDLWSKYVDLQTELIEVVRENRSLRQEIKALKEKYK